MMMNRLGVSSVVTPVTPVTLVMLAATAVLGCTETVDSKNVRTPGISATIEATAERADWTKLVATLKVGGDESNTYVDLNAGDKLTAVSGDEQVLMTAESTGVYRAQFDLGAADTEFKVLLERDVDDDAPGNVGTLPAPFDLVMTSAAPVSRADALVINWSPSGTNDDMHIRVEGKCIFSEDVDVGGDPGTYTIGAGKLRATSQDKAETCDLDLTVTRSRKGAADKGLDPESSFVLSQARAGKIISAP